MKDSVYFQQAKLLVSTLPEIKKESIFIAISESLERIIAGIQYTISNVRIVPRKDREMGLIIGFMVVQQKVTVKIEPNIVLRGSVYPSEKDSFCPNAIALFGNTVRLNRLSFPDLFGGKICAALDRQHPRDLFDVKLLLENEGITEEVRKAFIVYLISHPSQIHLDLTTDERHFILSIKNRHPDWSLWGIQHIDKLPAVQWKLKNLNWMDEKKYAEAVEKLKRCLNN